MFIIYWFFFLSATTKTVLYGTQDAEHFNRKWKEQQKKSQHQTNQGIFSNVSKVYCLLLWIPIKQDWQVLTLALLTIRSEYILSEYYFIFYRVILLFLLT